MSIANWIDELEVESKGWIALRSRTQLSFAIFDSSLQ